MNALSRVRTRPGRTPLFAASVALALAFLEATAQAAIASAIPEECGSWSELQGELQSRVGPNTSLDSTRVTLTPEDAGYHLVVEVGSERRELNDPNCLELMRAAVVIALALLEPHDEPQAKPEPVVTTPARQRDERRGQPSSLRVALAGGAGLHLGTIPKPTLLLDLDAQLLWARFGIAGGLRYLAPRSEQDENKHGARVSGIGGYLAASYEPWSRVQGRLGFVAYRLSGSGLGSVETSQGVAWEAGPTLGASYTPFRWAPFWTSVGAEGQLNLLRQRFQILNYNDEVFRVPRFSGSLFVRAGVIW